MAEYIGATRGDFTYGEPDNPFPMFFDGTEWVYYGDAVYDVNGSLWYWNPDILMWDYDGEGPVPEVTPVPYPFIFSDVNPPDNPGTDEPDPEEPVDPEPEEPEDPEDPIEPEPEDPVIPDIPDLPELRPVPALPELQDPEEPVYDTPYEELVGLHPGLREEQEKHIFHASTTIAFGELIESGWDWGRNEWPAFNETVRARVNKKIELRYYFRDLCDSPGKFKIFLQRKLNEIAPKYEILYKIIEENRLDILEIYQDVEKSKDIFSEYPQAQIIANKDYASTGTTRDRKSKQTGNVLEIFKDFVKNYDDVDKLFVDELSSCFSNLIDPNKIEI